MQRAVIPRIGAGDAWRKAARQFLATGVAPGQIIWEGSTSEPDLFHFEEALGVTHRPTAPRSFVAMADTVVWHSDPERFARLYAFVWRLQSAPHLMRDRADTDLARLRQMEKSVHRCQHKMKAFVRFREIGAPLDARRSFAAWFEPTHHSVEPTADFFARRFADMDWRILTPDVSALFENGRLRFEEGQKKPDLPDDASEKLWVTYFRNIFNPARLKVRAMQSEMPKKYWHNMPEAAAIPDLVATAPARARAMADAAPTLPPLRTEKLRAQFSLCTSAWDGPEGGLPHAIAACTRCPLHRSATQAVPGEGPRDADLMIVGEQPGDLEDLSGKPFVGPAGKLFDRMAAQAGLDRNKAYVTNAVKHFKFIIRGKRRIHQRPEKSEIDHCRWWLESELADVKPKLVLALGATAAEALTRRRGELMRRRGKIEWSPDGHPILITIHPSYLLRLPDPSAKAEATAQFHEDLTAAASLMTA